MSFKDRHQIIYVNYQGGYLEVKIGRELVEEGWFVLTTCQTHIPRYCKECDNHSNGGINLKAQSDKGFNYAIQELMNKLQEAIRKKRVYFQKATKDHPCSGFRAR